MGFKIAVIAFFALWLSPGFYAWFKKHEKRKLITFLILFFGPLGSLISLIILIHGSPAKIRLGDSGVCQCPHCGAPYRAADYRPDAEAICDTCNRIMTRPNQ